MSKYMNEGIHKQHITTLGIQTDKRQTSWLFTSVSQEFKFWGTE